MEEYTGYIDDGVKLLEEAGYQLNVLDISYENEEICREKILNSNIIWITGGNTFYLLQELQKKNIISILKDKVNKGCPYIGESAGGIILSKNIEYSKILDSVSVAPKLKDYRGLGLVDFYPLPHYIEEPFTETVQQTFEKYKDKVHLIPINNSQAIFVYDDTVEIR
ncbi:Type 1 glutamine amidotransferase-like domain-containing protein (plasmid) [Latilactobacillus sp. 5-91]|uniref:Type 1 glutamine amidotransferase-like domain-containing protein n=1 Tax=Latilactobacillus sp. 5-91 TaxID=3410924 RepID=UPI003C77E2DE